MLTHAMMGKALSRTGRRLRPAEYVRVQRGVTIRHGRAVEVIAGMLPASCRFDFVKMPQRMHGVVDSLREESGYAFAYDLRQRAAREGDYRRSRGGGLHRHQRAGLSYLAGDQYRLGGPKKFCFLLQGGRRHETSLGHRPEPHRDFIIKIPPMI